MHEHSIDLPPASTGHLASVEWCWSSWQVGQYDTTSGRSAFRSSGGVARIGLVRARKPMVAGGMWSGLLRSRACMGLCPGSITDEASRGGAEVESKVGCFREMFHAEGAVGVRVEWARLDRTIADEAVRTRSAWRRLGLGRVPHDYMSPMSSVRYVGWRALGVRGDDVEIRRKMCVRIVSVG